MGKYDRIINSLPRLLGTEPAYQIRVQAVKDEMLKELPNHASAFARSYAEIRAEKDEADDVLSEINLRLEAVSQLMAEAFEVEGTTKLTLDTGQTVSTYYEPAGRVVDKEAFRLWCIENGLERSLQLWPSTMVSLLKERLLAGEDAPAGVEAHARRAIRLSKGAA